LFELVRRGRPARRRVVVPLVQVPLRQRYPLAAAALGAAGAQGVQRERLVRVEAREERAQAVEVLRADNPDDPQLTAYLVGATDEAPAPNALRDFLKQKLPEHMVPPLYVVLEKLPLTPNGKVDRKALPVPEGNRVKPEAQFAAPAGNVEQQVAAIWKDILHVEQIGADDNFFDFGGHSLQVVQVQNRLRETIGVDVPVLKLFQFPTIRALARFIGEQGAASATADAFRARIEERAKRRQNAMTIRRRGAAPVEAA
jgi:acyl carrier protein